MTSEIQIQELLSAVTDALLADEQVDFDTIISRYSVPRATVEGLVGIIQRLHMVMVGEQPSRRFVRRLKQDLIGMPDQTVVWRIRHLPLRVQIAAGIALVAGFMLLTRRRMLEEVKHEQQEAPAI
jgi:hypothetical protein